MSSFSPQPIADNMILRKDEDFVRLSIGERDATRTALHAYFIDAKPAVDQQFMWSYFRWYTDLTWRMIARVSPEDMVSVVMSRQIPMALYLGHDVVEKILFYINDNAFLPKEKETLYHRMRQAFMQSTLVIGTHKGQDVQLKDIVADIVKHTKRGTDSIQKAELNRKVVEVFFSTIPQEMQRHCVMITPEEFRKQIFSVIAFFKGVQPENIDAIVELFVHPERFDPDWEGAQPSTIPEGMTGQEYVDAAKDEIDKFFGIGAYENEEPGIDKFLEDQKNKKKLEDSDISKKEKEVVEKPTAMSYDQIKTMIDSRFEKDASGEYTNIEGVMVMLSGFAADQNDPQIAELYYFDEQKGKFMWNNAILGT
jgi:hypothetical protein